MFQQQWRTELQPLVVIGEDFAEVSATEAVEVAAEGAGEGAAAAEEAGARRTRNGSL